MTMRNDMGALWENFFISERLKRNHYTGHYCNTYFWRTKSGQEIDYVEECDGTMTAFEMKWNPKKSRITFPKSFLEAYDVKETVVITYRQNIDFDGISVVFLRCFDGISVCFYTYFNRISAKLFASSKY